MIEIKDKKDCCGCEACFNVCPAQCISMKADNEGFLYPIIDKLSCINCGKCEKVCPIINFSKPNDKDIKEAYIVQNKSRQVLQDSTSGGAFTAIAEFVIENNGVVFGAYLDSENRVKHIYTKQKEELYKFRNSKYVQSSLGESFVQVKQFLEEKRLVCFSGTPCQIYALSTYLGKDYINLILIDVVCRAVPSPGVWESYLRYNSEKIGKPKSIRFRDKKYGYQYSTMVITSEEGKTERGGIESNPWLRMFFTGMIIRPSCTQCKFRNPSRYSDFTIWDCYNIHQIDKSFDENIGTTRMIVHSTKGLTILDSIKERLLCNRIQYDVIIKGCREMNASPQFHPLREAFFNDYKNMEMEQLLKKYFPMTLKIKVKKRTRLFLNKIGLDKMIKHLLKKE